MNLYVAIRHIDYEFDEILGIFDNDKSAQECLDKTKKIIDADSWIINIYELNKDYLIK